MCQNKVYTTRLPLRGILSCFGGHILFCILFLSLSINLNGQEENSFDEIIILVEIPHVGSFEVPSVISKDELYLPVRELFDIMRIRNVQSEDMETLTGFFISPEAVYSISYPDRLIQYQGKTWNLDRDELIRTETSLYLHSDYYGKVFGLDCNFNFRGLYAKIDSKLELPLIREMRRQEMRDNLSRLKGEIKADTNIKRTYPLLRFGMADWSAMSTQEINGKTDNRLNLSLGAMLAGGEATASLNYNSYSGFNARQQNYLWRYVDNDYRLFRQIMAGKINTQSIATIYNSVIGTQITNTPATYRRSFGTYILTDRTEPEWIVELYVNNVLVDYTKADASGFFKFEVPLVYGNSMVQLKYYGPWGEERVREQNIVIPYNFLPKNVFEYRISGGIVEDSTMGRFSRGSFGYGLTRRFTMGGGVEYLSTLQDQKAIPFVNASLGLFNNLLISGEYAYGVRTKGNLSYRLPTNIQLDVNYTKYDKDQTAIKYNYLEERKASLAIPFRIGEFSTYQRFSVYQIVVPNSEYTTGEWMFTGSLLGVSTNLTTSAIFIPEIDPNIFSNLSLSFRIPANITIRPQAQYGYNKKEFINFRVVTEKYIKGKAFISLSYDHNIPNNLTMAELGFRYNFSFAQAGMSVRQAGKQTSLIEYGRGSLLYDRKTKYLKGDDQPNVGRGGISVIPYLDLNANRQRDPGEPKAQGLKLRTRGGRVEISNSDTTLRILGLEPYTSYLIELDPDGFDNIAWRLPVRTLSVTVDPNILKHIEIPVSVVGEASGTVTSENRDGVEGIGRIIVSFVRNADKKQFNTLTESDGYFSYFGFVPGEYQVFPDTTQLRKLGMVADPVSRSFSIRSGLEGDIVEALDFRLRILMTDTSGKAKTQMKPVIKKDTTYMIVHEIVQELQTITKDSWAIQLGAFRNRNNAENLRKNLERLLGRKVEIIFEDDLFKVRIDEIEERKQVDKIIEVLRKNGITELWVISLKAKQQQFVLVEKRDSIRTITETVDSVVTEKKADIAGKIFMNLGRNFYKIDMPHSRVVESEMVRVMDKNRPSGELKVRNLWIRPIDIPVTETEPEPEPEIKREPVIIDRIVGLEIPPFFISPDDYLISPVVHTTTSRVISLQVGVFYKKADAVKAQKKIMSRLSLPVKIVQQWEYYRVIITGFTSREETFQYYPELAGMGYPGVQLIEE